MNIIIKTQAELDALPASFQEYTVIEIHGGTIYSRIAVTSKRENSSVVARGNSSVVARENSSVVARGNSSVEARGNSSVVAWENSSVVARENSSVVARGNVGVHVFSESATIEAWGFVVVWLLVKAKVALKSKTAQAITPTAEKGVPGWLDREGVVERDGKVIVFKRVSSDWKTREKTNSETLWAVGSTLEHADWSPDGEECGAGKYHACSRPYFCDEFRDKKGDKYIAIEVIASDLFAWDGAQYPHKIAFRKGTVLHECNRMGRKIEVVT